MSRTFFYNSEKMVWQDLRCVTEVPKPAGDQHILPAEVVVHMVRTVMLALSLNPFAIGASKVYVIAAFLFIGAGCNRALNLVDRVGAVFSNTAYGINLRSINDRFS